MKKIISILFVLLLVMTSCKMQETSPETAVTDSVVENKEVSAEMQESPTVSDEPETEYAKENETVEKKIIEVSESIAHFTQEELIQNAVLIIRGKVIRNNGYVMTNPDGTRKSALNDEWYILNQQITSYTVEISEIYKGTYSGSTIEVKTANGMGLTPDLILYGEDETSILASPMKRRDLQVGKECILLLQENTEENTNCSEEMGFFPIVRAGYLLDEGNGIYSNNLSGNSIKLSAVDPGAEIAAALNTVTE